MSLVNSIAQVVSPREDRTSVKAALVDLGADGSPNYKTYRSFQYFPETISDSRSSEWQAKNVIGGSHPLYQWVNGSGREISFEAIFTRDAKSLQSDGSLLSTLNTIESFAKNPIGSAISLIKRAGNNNDEGDYSVKIEGAVAWLRSKTYPSYVNRVAVAPPRMLLVLPGTGIFSGTTAPRNSFGDSLDTVPVVMTSCNITYESFFRTGEPRAVTVALGFAEIIQTSASNWGYVDSKKFNNVWQNAPYAYNKGQGVGTAGRPLLSPAKAGPPVSFIDQATKLLRTA